MAFERGFRRILIVLSAICILFGAGCDLVNLPGRSAGAILVTLADGRQLTLQNVKSDLIPTAAEQALVDRLGQELTRDGFTLGKLDRAARQAVDRYGNLVTEIHKVPGFDTTGPPDKAGFSALLVQWWSVRQVEILEPAPGRISWWWAHAYGTTWAVGLIALLWGAFYAMRWVVRGFTG